jgi:hypothetical protein
MTELKTGSGGGPHAEADATWRTKLWDLRRGRGGERRGREEGERVESLIRALIEPQQSLNRIEP